MFTLTNRNIRRRFKEAQAVAKANGEIFTYRSMAELFKVDERTIYTWITKVLKLQHLPANQEKREALLAWINGGEVLK